ncbi:MAG TPA: ComF family protein [Verrucomicrobiae bacterium]|jgi:ComF family protein|nr:ComF family protein [Verrucomicrobiae bacterium]
MINQLKSALDAALNFIYPPVCRICEQERATASEGYVGGKCWSRLRFVKPPFCDRCGLPYEGSITHTFRCENCAGIDFGFRFARSAVVANGMFLQVIHSYKYQRAVWFEPFLGDLLTRQAAPALAAEKWDMIVPVPLHPGKEREREFNQAERLARRLGRTLGLPVRTRLVRRTRFTTTQTLLTRPERAANVKNAFAPRAGKQLDGEKVILVDDVMTTGATTSACARALRQCGAGDICVWTVARGL